jgi:hypothetical protein
MWGELRKRTPLWAFTLTIVIVGAILGHLYISNSNTRDLAKENATILKNEFQHINDSLAEIKRRM